MQVLLTLHSVFRWLVLGSLLLAIYRAFTGIRLQRVFGKKDDRVRHWTATIAHSQLVIGIILYSKSPIIKYFWGNFGEASAVSVYRFFGLIHIVLMLIAVVLITVGSAMAKRKGDAAGKFQTMLAWYVAALALICVAIPWPFSPFAQRPLLTIF